MSDWIDSLLDGSYMPHGHCLLWQTDLLYMHVGSDFVIALSYFSIPAALALIAYKRKDWGFNSLFWLFCAFILACGTSHIVETINVWNGYYYFEGYIKVITALVSATTAVLLWPLVPRLLALPSMADIEEKNVQLLQEVQLRSNAEDSLRQLNQSLEEKIAARTQELELANQALQQEITQSNERKSQLEAVMNGSPSLIFLKDTNFRFITANKAFLDTYGLSRDDIQGKSNHELFPAELADHFEATDHAVMESTQVSQVSVVLKVKGIDRLFNAEKYKFYDHTGKVLGIAGIARDITEEKEAEHNKAFLASIVEYSQDAILSKDLSSIVTSWNPAATALFGYREEEAIGQSVTMLIPPDRQEEEQLIISQLKAGKPIKDFDTIRMSKPGKSTDVSVLISPIYNENKEIVGASSTIRDITARKEAEKEIKEKSKQLQASNHALNEFVYIASHDLKAPLRGINNYAKFLMEDYHTLLDDDGKKFLNGIVELSTKMDSLLQDLLTYSRIEQLEENYTQRSLNKILSSVAERFIGENDFSISIPDQDFEIRCDKTKLTEAFANLFDNAIKYNQSPEKTLHVSSQVTEENIEIRFTDNGIGIPEHQHQEIFKIFYKGNSPEQYPDGSGSGLAIVKKIIENHRGKITVENSDETGSTFLITFPYHSEKT